MDKRLNGRILIDSINQDGRWCDYQKWYLTYSSFAPLIQLREPNEIGGRGNLIGSAQYLMSVTLSVGLDKEVV